MLRRLAALPLAATLTVVAIGAFSAPASGATWIRRAQTARDVGSPAPSPVAHWIRAARRSADALHVRAADQGR